jgi:hypothetical protein
MADLFGVVPDTPRLEGPMMKLRDWLARVSAGVAGAHMQVLAVAPGTVPAQTVTHVSVAYRPAKVGNAVMAVSNVTTAGILIGVGRVLVDGTAVIPVANITAGSIAVPAGNWFVYLFRR